MGNLDNPLLECCIEDGVDSFNVVFQKQDNKKLASYKEIDF